MPGVIYRALSKTTYDFSSGTGMVNSSSALITVAKGVDVSAYREATLALRIHSIAAGASTASIRVDVFPEAPTQEDPATDFIGPNTVATTTTIVVSSSLSPTLNLQPLSPNFGAALRVKLAANQPSVVLSTFLVTLSIDLVAKS